MCFTVYDVFVNCGFENSVRRRQIGFDNFADKRFLMNSITHEIGNRNDFQSVFFGKNL